MNITKRIATVLKESYKKKSLAHLYNSFWLFIYSACKLQTLKSALKEQRLDNTFLELKKIIQNYDFPVFPEDFAYYLLSDNNTLIMVSAMKNVNKNLQFDIKKKKLKIFDKTGKLDFVISTYAKNCGYSSLNEKYKCKIYKPLISNNLIN